MTRLESPVVRRDREPRHGATAAARRRGRVVEERLDDTMITHDDRHASREAKKSDRRVARDGRPSSRRGCWETRARVGERRDGGRESERSDEITAPIHHLLKQHLSTVR